MDENRYKSAFDKIKCSREFYMQMTKRLSESGDEYHEFSETVSHVDVAKPAKYRYAAVGTAACLAVCAAGFGFWKISDSRNKDNSKVETDDIDEIENPVIMPVTTQPVTTQPPVSENEDFIKEGETSDLLADIIQKTESGEVKPMYDQSPDENDNSYAVNYDPAELKGWLERLRQIYWTKKTISAEEFQNYYKHITIMGELYFTTDGIIRQCNGKYELHTPEKMGSRTVYDNTLKKMTVRRYQNLEEFLTNYKELSPVMTADMEYNAVFNELNYIKLDEFAGEFIGFCTDFEYKTSGKVYYDRDDEIYFTHSYGTQTNNGEEPYELDIGCVTNGDFTDSIVLSDENAFPRLWPTGSALVEDGIVRGIFYHVYPSDFEGVMNNEFYKQLIPGDYFILRNYIIKEYRKFMENFAGSGLALDDELVVKTSTDENGELMLYVIMYNDNDKENWTHDSAVCFAMNEQGIITKFVEYEKGRLVAECNLSNIKYEDFETPDSYETFSELTLALLPYH